MKNLPVTYRPSELLDAVKAHLNLDSDAALSRALDVPPTIICNVRHRLLPVGPSLLLHMLEATGMRLRELKALGGLLPAPDEPVPATPPERRGKSAFPYPGDPGYDPGRLLDTLLARLKLKNDAALARVLDILPSLLSKIRHQKLPLGPTLLLAIHELSGIPFHELRRLMQSPRRRTTRRVYVTAEKAAAKLKTLREIAESHDGRCLADAYIQAHAHLEFHCSKHGAFKARPSHILAGHWCRECAVERSKGNAPQRLVDYIRERGGVLMSPYINARTQVLIRCKQHGVWQASPDNLLNKASWCKRCASSLPRPGRKKAVLRPGEPDIAQDRAVHSSQGQHI